MSTIVTRVDRHAPAFKANAAHYEALLAELRARHTHALAGGGARLVQRHHERNKMLARERIDLLLDPDAFRADDAADFAAQRRAKLRVFLGRNIDADHAVDTSLLAFVRKPFRPAPQNGGHNGNGFDIVHRGGAAIQTRARKIGRAHV